MTYLIKNDGYKYQEFALEIDDILDYVPDDSPYKLADFYNFSQKNMSFKNWWQSIDTEFTPIEGSDNPPVPDIAQWIGATLVLSEKACSLLKDALIPHGEILPVMVEGARYFIFNCLELTNADEAQSQQEYFEGEPVSVSKLVFDSDSVKDKSIFKSNYTNSLDLYCNETFKQLVIENELKGIIFSETLTREF